jgi:hypothetical protein
MTLQSVVLIVPVEKATSDTTVPLSATGENPPTHMGGHGWMKVEDIPVPKPDEAVSSRTDSWAKENVEKLPVPPEEKYGREHFDQIIAAQGLRRVAFVYVAKEDSKEIKP